jgi:hypothetical protein
MFPKLKIVIMAFTAGLLSQQALATNEPQQLISITLSCSEDKSGKGGYSEDFWGIYTSISFSSTRVWIDKNHKNGDGIMLFYGDLRNSDASISGYGTRFKSKYKWKYEFSASDVASMKDALFVGLPGFENKGDRKYERECLLKANNKQDGLGQIQSMLIDVRAGKRLPSVIDDYRKQIKQFEEAANIAEASAQELERSIASLETQLDAANASSQASEQSIAALEAQLDSQKKENQQLQLTIETANNAQAELTGRLQLLTEENESQRAATEEAQAELAEAKKQPELVSELNSKVSELSDNAAKQSSEINVLKGDRDELERKLASAESALEEKNKALSDLQDDLEKKGELELKVKELESELADSAVGSKQLGALATTISELKETLAGKDAYIEEKAASLSEAQAEIESLQARLSALEFSNNEIASKYQETQTELDALTDLSNKMQTEISTQKSENEKLLAAASAPKCETEKKQINYLKSKVEVCEKTLLGDSSGESNNDSGTTSSSSSKPAEKPSATAQSKVTPTENVPMLRLTLSGDVDGQLIHQSKSFKYYRCENVVSPQLIEFGFRWLGAMSDRLGVPAPSNSSCVVSKGFGPISVKFFVSAQNSRCFYKNFCNDTRDMSFVFKNNQLYLNFMVINAKTKLTRQQCVNLDGKIVSTKGCNAL